uniref:Uncharacterized protein n=1 Tax=Bactrocera dorsalis TaxID=27457 RepID=A0A034WTA9_BACDO
MRRGHIKSSSARQQYMHDELLNFLRHFPNTCNRLEVMSLLFARRQQCQQQQQVVTADNIDIVGFLLHYNFPCVIIYRCFMARCCCQRGDYTFAVLPSLFHDMLHCCSCCLLSLFLPC